MAKKIVDEYFAKYQDECLVIYSMWKGYLDESNKAKNEKLIDFFSSYPYKCLHTSGHADVESLKKVVEVIKPKHIIPIHTEKPDEFKNLFENTILLENGIVLYAVK